MHCLFCDCLPCYKEAILASYAFLPVQLLLGVVNLKNGSVGLKVANVYYYDLCLEHEFCKFSSFLERAVLDREGVGTIPQ